jgi:hypothetical protein
VREPLEPVEDELLVHDLLTPPSRVRLDHRQAQTLADAAEVKAGLGLDGHGEIPSQVGDRLGVDQLAHERPDRDVDELRRRRPGGDDEDVSIEVAGIGSLHKLRAAGRCFVDETARDGCRVGDAVLAADERAGHVVGSKAGDD